jgi:hypothetical protein
MAATVNRPVRRVTRYTADALPARSLIRRPIIDSFHPR